MAKRFTDTKKWDHAWFRKLSPVMKCVWEYLCDACDNCGVWIIDPETLSHFVGAEVTLEEILRALSGKVFLISRDRLLIPGFIRFQYGKELKENSNPHKGVLKALKDNGLSLEEINRLLENPSPTLGEPFPKGSVTLKDKDQDKNKDQEGGSGGNSDDAVGAAFDPRWPEYEKALSGVLRPVHLDKIKFYRAPILRFFKDVEDLRQFVNPYLKALHGAATSSRKANGADPPAPDEISHSLFQKLTRSVSEWSRLSEKAHA